MTPVLVRGMLFDSPAACAKHFGRNRKTVYAALSRGIPDSIGIGRGVRPHARRKGGKKAIPFKLGGVSYASMRQASIALGFAPTFVANAMRQKRPASMQRIIAAAMQLAAAEDRRVALEREVTAKNANVNFPETEGGAA